MRAPGLFLVVFSAVVLNSIPAWAQSPSPSAPAPKPAVNSPTPTEVPGTTDPAGSGIEAAPPPPSAPVREKINEAKEEMADSKSHRSLRDKAVMIGYGGIDLWIPSKIGGAFVYRPTSASSWELEYMRGSLSTGVFGIDLGSISDQRLSLLKRSFKNRNSFHYIYGIEYTNVEVEIGNDMLATADPSVGSYDMLKVSTLGLAWGIGNRWQLAEGFTFGIDWFLINVPLAVLESENGFIDATTDPEDKEDAKDLFSFLEDYPTVSILKLQLGYSF